MLRLQAGGVDGVFLEVLSMLRWSSVDRCFIFCYAAVWQRCLVCLGVLLMPRMSSVDRLPYFDFCSGLGALDGVRVLPLHDGGSPQLAIATGEAS